MYNQLEELLKSTESKEESFDNDINRINELIKVSYPYALKNKYIKESTFSIFSGQFATDQNHK